MRLSHLGSALLLVFAGLTPTNANELAKIDRSLKDEPKYDTKTPKYCLVVFGLEAKTQVWLVRDGKRVHVLDSPDGKSPRRWRVVRSEYGHFTLGDIWAEEGKTRYKDLRFSDPSVWATLQVQFGRELQWAGRDRSGRLELATSAKDAPVVHFHGPASLDLFHNQKPFISGKRVTMTAVVGTPGLGKGSFAHYDCADYPKNAWPLAIIEYPAKEGGKPIADKLVLDDD